MKNIEILVGTSVALLVYLFLNGYNILPIIFLIALITSLYLYNGKAMTKGKNFVVSPKIISQNISFEDIGGQEIAKNELSEALDFVKNSEEMKALGIRPLKGILLNGPPGTGKTLLAKAAAQYTDSIFLSASGSEFVEMYVGVGAKRVRELFNQAKQAAKKEKKASAVIFIDEMEVLGGKRGNNSHQEHEQTLNELLVQMDGMSSNEDVRILVIAATNRADMLDSALLRPGRFDRLVRVDLPDKKGRVHILKLHIKNKPISKDVSIEKIAKDSFGFSGAQLESVTNEAAIMAMRDGSKEINSDHFHNAIEKVMMGEKLDRVPNNEEKRRIAIHESGHALIGELMFPNSVASVNVASRSNALGYVRQTQQEDIYLYTHEYLKSRISVALAGVIAEEIILKSRSTGGSSDFKHASDMAKQIIYSGMSELGIISSEDIPKDQVHNIISKILREVENETNEVLCKNKSYLEGMTELLLDRETLSGDEIRILIHGQNSIQCV